MNPDEKRLLEENLAVAKETNALLKKMVSAQRWARAFHIFYWVLIIGASVGAYYFVQPYLQQVLGNYDAIMNGLNNVQKTTSSLPDSSSLNSIIQNFRPK